MSEDLFQEGDEFDVPPIQASRIISKILAAGGKFKLVGNIVKITEIKNKVKVSFPKAEEEPPVEEKEPVKAVEVVEEPKVEVEKPKVEEKKPVTRGRKPKATSTENKE